MLGSHLIISMYGFWLPNDPRGSWSDFVGAYELYRHGGPATRINDNYSVAHAAHDVALRLETKRHLKYAAVVLNKRQVMSLADGFANRIRRSALTIWAASILPDRCHFVVAPHRLKIEQIANLLKGDGTRALIRDGLHPLAQFAAPDERPPASFARGEWKVFLYTEEDIYRAIRYVEDNPVKEGLKSQTWPFVTSVDGTLPASATADLGRG